MCTTGFAARATVTGILRLLPIGLALALGAACSIPDVELAGRPCPCVTGWVCDDVSGTCVLDVRADAGLDAGRDAGARVDAGSFDGGVTIDGGAPDGGTTTDGGMRDGGCSASTRVTGVWGDATGSDHPGTVLDTWINIGDERHATAGDLRLYTWPTAQVANAILMQWDLSAIAPGASITSATLELHQRSAVGATYRATLHEVVGCRPDIAGDRVTGNQCSATRPWTANACCFTGIPMGQADIGPAVDTVTLNATNGTKSWNATELVRRWVAEPTANRGLMVNADATARADDERSFGSTESPTASQRPRLTVTYSSCE